MSSACKKRKAYHPTDETVRSLSGDSAHTFEQLNRRANCPWKCVNVANPPLPGNGPNPNRTHSEYTKQVFLQMPQARPGDVVVMRINDGFVAEAGGFALPNSVYIAAVPDDYVMPANGAVCMALLLPINSWHKRQDPRKPGSKEKVWVYTEYARSARVVSIAIYTMSEGISGVLETCVVQPTIQVREDDGGNVYWPSDVSGRRKLAGISSRDALLNSRKPAFQNWLLKRASILKGSYSKVKSYTAQSARLTRRPISTHIDMHTPVGQGRPVPVFSPSHFDDTPEATTRLWGNLVPGVAVVWRPTATHPRFRTAFAIGTEVAAASASHSVWSDHIVGIRFVKVFGASATVPKAHAVMMRAHYNEHSRCPGTQKQTLCVGFADVYDAKAFLHAMEPIPAHVAVRIDDARMPEPVKQQHHFARSCSCNPKPTPLPRPRMPTDWEPLNMPRDKFAAPAFHPFTELEVCEMRNKHAMALYLPKLRGLLPAQHPPLPKIDCNNYETEVIDKLLALCPNCKCNDAKAVWKRNVVAELNAHSYNPHPEQEGRVELYAESDPWHALVNGANGFNVSICSGLDGGSLHPVMDRMALHNLRVARKEQQKSIAEWRAKIQAWDEEHAEVFESAPAISYEEAFRRKDQRLRREKMVVLE